VPVTALVPRFRLKVDAVKVVGSIALLNEAEMTEFTPTFVVLFTGLEEEIAGIVGVEPAPPEGESPDVEPVLIAAP
jgi:hypothetical protein